MGIEKAIPGIVSRTSFLLFWEREIADANVQRGSSLFYKDGEPPSGDPCLCQEETEIVPCFRSRGGGAPYAGRGPWGMGGLPRGSPSPKAMHQGPPNQVTFGVPPGGPQGLPENASASSEGEEKEIDGYA